METAITGLNQTATASGTTKTPTKEMDKNAFLMLLVQQLKNQDPTQAQDPNQMVQQMTAYSSLEQMQNQSKLLEGIQSQNLGLFQTGVASLVGKHIEVASPSFELKDNKATLNLDLLSDAEVTLTIKDADGKVVATLPQGQMKAGSKSVEWNGTTASGEKLPDGTYTVEITAKDATGKAVDARSTSSLKVDSVSFAGGQVFLMAGGRQWNLSDISKISA